MAYGENDNGGGMDAEDGAGEAAGKTVSAYKGDLLAKLNSIDKRVNRHWREAHKEMRECYDMVAGRQWPKEALEQFEIDERWAVCFNRTDPMVSAICGAEVTNRQTVQFSPRTPGDAKIDELLTGAVQWSRDECCANDEESHAFRDAVIAGLGCTETRMDYLDDLDGMTKIDRVSPLEMYVDDAARKPNYTDRTCQRRNRPFEKEMAAELFPELFEYASAPESDAESGAHRNEPGDAYRHTASPLEGVPEGMIEIKEYQWFELERVVAVVDPDTGKKVYLDPEDYDAKNEQFLRHGMDLNGVPMKRKCFWRAFRAGDECSAEKLPEGKFTYEFITGKIDETKGTPYGVVRAMIDPQRYSNKAFMQMDRLIAKNAKGGLILNKAAFEDHEQIEDTITKGGAVLWAEEGELAEGTAVPIPVPQIPTGITMLFQFVNSILPQTVGINEEMLGMVQRDQPAILEYQRKQAAYGVLSTFFDNLKHYRVLQGRHHLLLIQKYMTDGRVIRINGTEAGKDRYVQLLPMFHDPDTAKFDVIVDESPSGPNQRERTWAVLQSLPQMLQMLSQLPPEVAQIMLESSPLPASVTERIFTAWQKFQQDPQRQQDEAQKKQLMQARAQTALQKDASAAAKNEADARKSGAQADSEALDAEMKRRIAAMVPGPPQPVNPLAVLLQGAGHGGPPNGFQG